MGKRYYKLHQIELLRPIYNINWSMSSLVFLLEITSTHSSHHCQTSVYIWNANTNFRSQIKSRNKWLISKLSCWRCYTYTEGKEQMFKIWIKSSWSYWSYRLFSTVFVSVKDNLTIFNTLFSFFFFVFQIILACFWCFLFWCRSRKSLEDNVVLGNWYFSSFWIMVKLIIHN